MKPFWRDTHFLPAEQQLYDALMDAHHRSSQRNNASSAALRNAWLASGDYTKALAGALATLGKSHGPIEETQRFLAGNEMVSSYLADGRKVPGWGNSFHRGYRDPLWLEMENLLTGFPIAARLAEVTADLHLACKILYPNPSAYTAATAIVLGLPAELSPYLFVRGRLEGWTEQLLRKDS